ISPDLVPLTRTMPIAPVPGEVAMAAIVSSKYNNLAKAKYLTEEKGDDKNESHKTRLFSS
ncbi:MAG: hypothetical protein ACXWMO_06580, partial [Syntrophales bacterium]